MAEVVTSLLAAMDRQEAVAIATVIQADESAAIPVGLKLLVRADGSTVGDLGAKEQASWLMERVAADAVRLMPEGRTAVVSYEAPPVDGQPRGRLEVAIEVFLPPPTVVILGAGHIAVPVSRIAKLLGYAVTVVDDRTEFANRERFPEADEVIARDFVEAIDQLTITPSTYFVLVTRGHKHDEVSLARIIRMAPAYIGMIGSKRRVRAVLRHLAAEGVPEEQLRRVYSPIGIDIGAETPEEIAVAILAEIIKARRGGKAKSMSEK